MSWNILLLVLFATVVTADFPAFTSFGNMQPMAPFPSFQMNGVLQTQQQQNQQQTQGQSAATGDGSADSGSITSAQNSNTNTSDAGTLSTGGSLGQCNGGNCKLSGAAQVGNQGSFQSQGTGGNIINSQGKGGFSSGGGFPNFGMFANNNNNLFQNQFQSQFQGSGASVGSGSVDKGVVNSAQNTNAITNKQGTNVLSTNVGQAAGSNAALSGAVQASGQGQTAGQQKAQTSGTQSQALKGQGGTGGMDQTANGANMQSQTQTQSQGTGASAGESNAVEGAIQNLLSSNVDTDATGTRVSSNAANTATGKGLKVSGAVSAGGQSGSQGQNAMNLSLFKQTGIFAKPMLSVRIDQPQPLAVY